MKSQQNWAAAICAQVGPVPLIEGMPGVAKTAFFRSLARAARRRFMQIILRQRMPEDASGIPVPTDFTDMVPGQTIRGVQHLLGEDMLRAIHEPTLILLDEINHASHDTLGSYQEWINSPPPDCWMAACQNPIEQSTNGVELSPPAINRMCKLEWEIPRDAIREGWKSGFLDYPEPTIPIVPADYLEQYGANHGELLCEFETRFPALFGASAYPKDAANASQPWPSYRSWTNVGKLLAACDAVWANKATRAHCVIGCVGEGAGNQFLQWASLKDLPDPEELLARPDQLKLPNRFDLVRTILGSVISAVEENKTPDRWERLFDLIEVAFTQQPETSLASEGKVWKIKPEGHTPKLRNGVAAEMRKARLGA